MKKICYVILQCSWGIFQTLMGSMLYLAHSKNPHYLFRGAYVTEWKQGYGLSLGLFIFIPPKADRMLLSHEYGHTIQSMLLGPFYLPVIGLPSFLWCRLPFLIHMREKHHISYYAFYPERWADHLGGCMRNNN